MIEGLSSCRGIDDFMIIKSWNVRGVGNPLKRRRIQSALGKIRPNWVGLQESKIINVDSSIISQLTG